jgi:hypothetical protein
MTRASLTTLAVVLLAAGTASAVPGEQRLLTGTLVWPGVIGPAAGMLPEGFVVVQGDDGRHYFVDVAVAFQRRPVEVRAGERVAIVGVEGARPQMLMAITLDRVDAGLPDVAPPPAASPPTGPVVPPADEPRDRPLSGHVDEIAGSSMTLRTADGIWTVDLSRVRPALDVLRPGDEVMIFGQPDEEDAERRRFLATGFVHVGPAASALPRPLP